jgi:hypothetical protein
LILLLGGLVELTTDEVADLRALLNGWEVPARIATRARMVLWRSEGRQMQEVAVLARGVAPDGGLVAGPVCG